MEIGPVKVSLQPPRRNRSHRRPGTEYVSAIDGGITPRHPGRRPGQVIGSLKDPGISNPICSPFSGRFMGRLVLPGEQLWKGQPVAWLRSMKLG
jgi:biotin carboxyl carrier protein